jgi:hypothetical protein
VCVKSTRTRLNCVSPHSSPKGRAICRESSAARHGGRRTCRCRSSTSRPRSEERFAPFLPRPPARRCSPPACSPAGRGLLSLPHPPPRFSRRAAPLRAARRRSASRSWASRTRSAPARSSCHADLIWLQVCVRTVTAAISSGAAISRPPRPRPPGAAGWVEKGSRPVHPAPLLVESNPAAQTAPAGSPLPSRPLLGGPARHAVPIDLAAGVRAHRGSE